MLSTLRPNGEICLLIFAQFVALRFDSHTFKLNRLLSIPPNHNRAG